MSGPITTPPGWLQEFRVAVQQRDLRLAAWVGLDPASVFKLDDYDPDENGMVKVTWQSTVMERPTRGALTETGGYCYGDEPTRYTGTLMLDPLDAEAMLAVVGPKPRMLTLEQEAQLRARFGGGDTPGA